MRCVLLAQWEPLLLTTTLFGRRSLVSLPTASLAVLLVGITIYIRCGVPSVVISLPRSVMAWLDLGERLQLIILRFVVVTCPVTPLFTCFRLTTFNRTTRPPSQKRPKSPRDPEQGPTLFAGPLCSL